VAAFFGEEGAAGVRMNGVLEWWSGGVMEWWSVGNFHYSNTPILHHSIYSGYFFRSLLCIVKFFIN
jgi:hypothetical protein